MGVGGGWSGLAPGLGASPGAGCGEVEVDGVGFGDQGGALLIAQDVQHVVGGFGEEVRVVAEAGGVVVAHAALVLAASLRELDATRSRQSGPAGTGLMGSRAGPFPTNSTSGCAISADRRCVESGPAQFQYASPVTWRFRDNSQPVKHT